VKNLVAIFNQAGLGLFLSTPNSRRALREELAVLLVMKVIDE
jgi:hypothetical protein